MRLWLSICFLLFFMTCETKTTVKLEGENPPIFVLSGSGRLVSIYISDVDLAKQASPSGPLKAAVWAVRPASPNGEYLWRLGPITYGIVPRGYLQIVPASGVSPPPLIIGKRYGYSFQTLNAPGDGGEFEIREGKAVKVND